MAKIDGADSSLYLNPSIYAKVKEKNEDKKSGAVRKTDFSNLFESLRGKTADELGPLHEFPVSEDSVNFLMDEVRSCGDSLLNRPFPEEIARYKQAVRNFINYVKENNYSVGQEEGIPNFLKPGFSGRRGTPEAMKGKAYIKITVIDQKLEELSKVLLSRQASQLKLLSSLEEIRGLLVDLLQ